MNKTELRIEYADRTWNFDWPDSIDQALEEDYVLNRETYTDEVLNLIRGLVLIAPNIQPIELIYIVHNASYSR